MRRFFLAIALAGSLAGCAQFQKDFSFLTSATVSPTAVTVAVNLFDGVEATATNYLRLPKCTATSGAVCRNKAVAVQIIAAVKSGRVARNNLEQFLAGHQTALGVQGDYDAINAAVNTLQAILAQYNH